jgi:FG-GAP repeat
MWLPSLLRFQPSGACRARRAGPSQSGGRVWPCRLMLEQLEDRTVPASFLVTNLNDAGDGSLRQAILDANGAAGADDIQFQAGLTGIITLTDELSITDSVSIDGPGAEVITISGNNATRLFTIDSQTATVISVSISGLTLTQGNADAGNGNVGGAISIINEELTIANAVITGNTAATDGGGVYGTGGNATIRIQNSTISGNTAGRDAGGVFFGTASTGSIENSTLSGNTAGDDGGAVYLGNSSSVTIQNSTISGNTSNDEGGGIYDEGDVDSFMLRNSTISGNTVTNGTGGGLALNSNTVSIQNSTITGNQAPAGEGGGIFTQQSITLESTIVAGNTASNDNDVSSAGSPRPEFSVSFSLIQDVGTATIDDQGNNQFGVDPLLGALTDNGGPTQTHALQPNSPALDTGSNPENLAFDQRGSPFVRTLGTQTDIGAVEGLAQAPPPQDEPPQDEIVEPPIVVGGVYAVGAGVGGGPHVKVFGADGTLVASFFAYGTGFTGGVRVAVGDVNGDGTPDVVTGTGPGASPHVKVIDGTRLGQVQADGQIADGALLASFFAFRPDFTGGVFVAAGDVNGDSRADVIVGADAGAGPHVRVIDATQLDQVQADGQIADVALLASFFAYDVSFGGGVRVGTADVNGDGRIDVLTGSGSGAAAHVRAIDALQMNQVSASGQIADVALLASFLASGSSLTGIFVAGGDLTGDGSAEIVISMGPVGSLQAQVIDGARVKEVQASGIIADSAVRNNLTPFAGFSGGVRVGMVDADGDGLADLVVGAALPGRAHIKLFDGPSLAELDSFFAFDGFTGGAFAGGT